MQLDGISIVKWGIEGLETPPTWIEMSQNFTNGLSFKVEPTEQDEGQYTVIVELIDDNEEPLSNEFSFDLFVINPDKLDFLKKNVTVQKEQQ